MKRAMLAVMLGAAVSSLPAGADAGALPAVMTSNGPVQGQRDGPVDSWKGIPFAAPPVAALRWRMPQPPVRWSHVLKTTEYRHDCMQKLFIGDAAPLGTPPSEDCLYLNIWKPSGARHRPVLVWIYGGGFVNGGSSPPTYSGAALARQGIMVVSFNYRLGRFGTFVHPALDRAHEDGPLTANYGYMDQIAALRWVKRNIEAFGGDPRKVTIMGESAGGMSVHVLLTSPLSRGLFRGAIIMSGGDGTQFMKSGHDVAERAGIAFGNANDVRASDPQALVKLRALPGDQVVGGLNLASLLGSATRDTYAPPFADGRIAVDVTGAYASHRFVHVPVIVGATSDDIGGPKGVMIAGARSVAKALSANHVPVYYYNFGYVAESLPQRGAGHASDIPFFLHTENIKYGAATTARDIAMGATISSYVVNFVRTGNPNGAGLPSWASFTPSLPVKMSFAPGGTARSDIEPETPTPLAMAR